MEILDKFADFFSWVTGAFERLVTGVFGSSNERQIRKIGFAREKDGSDSIVPGSIIDQINQLEPDYQKLSNDELKQTATKLRARLDAGETLDDVMSDAFAAVREAGVRFLKMRHYDVQLVGGYILHQGMISEMVTGEGKTLVATLPAFLNALAGGVHLVTVNDYLARRDMEWMAPIYMGLGLTVGNIQSQMNPAERRVAYDCDITYGTNNEFGFDYLRDNMKPTKEQQAQGVLNFAIVDEIDNILIDEARTPLIISGPAQDDITKYSKADRIAKQLKKGVDFEVKEKEHSCHLTDAGVRHAEELAGIESFYTAGNMHWPHLIDNSLKAYHLYKNDVNYVVNGGEVVIVDEFTGRLMAGRQWSDGLHQAVEAKEGVPIKAENQTLATITLQNYFKLYKKLCGMTGTAMTEAGEFWKIYQLDVVNIPTNRKMRRVNYPDKIYRTEKEKWNALAEEVKEVNQAGRPILVGTVSIEKSEILSNKLGRLGVDHEVLNAKQHGREAEIIAQAGRKGAVTIATNMAGRGTDIILGGNPENMAWEILSKKYESRLDIPKEEWDATADAIAEREGMIEEGKKVVELGGLYVIGTERHEARRIDLQLRGRCGRQGDPGSSRFLLSLQDDLMRVFAGEWVGNFLEKMGMQEGEAIESGMVTRRVEGAQKKVEERHFEMRKHLLDYDEVMDEQRKRVYSYRQNILDGSICRDLILDMIDTQVDQGVDHYLDINYRWETVSDWASQLMHVEIDSNNVRGMDKEQLVVYLREEANRQAGDLIVEQVEENIPEGMDENRDWNWLALSKWANGHFGLNTNDRELIKLGRDEVVHYLQQRAHEAIERFDYEPLEVFLAEDWGRISLDGWLRQQFTLDATPEEFEGLSVSDAGDLIIEKIRKLYADKEISFPVAVGMTNFMSEQSGTGGKSDREGLVRWVNSRFQTAIEIDQLKSKPRSEVHNLLADCSKKYFVNGAVLSTVDEYLDRAFGDESEILPDEDGPQTQDDQAIQQLADWTNETFQSDLDGGELATLPREDVKTRVLAQYDQKYRPELSHAERSLILEVLDTAWKEHLYYMDHLRQGIGLVGYAQKDPKVEYKREGMKAFSQMWDRVGQQVTTAIFRLDQESPAFVGSLWQITETTHEEVESSSSYSEDSGGGQLEPGQTAEAIDPIINNQPKVGRNDPCPCGSGKKFKKCHGKQ